MSSHTKKRITHEAVWKRNPSEKNSFNSDEIHLVLPFLKRKRAHKVLDIACGNGLGVSLPLLREGYDVSSFDKWKSAVVASRKNADAEGFKIGARTGDMYKKFPYTSSIFDASFCFQAIYHGSLSQIENTLREIKRVTKQGGYFFGTFLPYYIRTEGSKSYFNYTMKNGRIGRIYVKPSNQDKFLCYNLSETCEYMVPHYHFTKENLKSTLKKYFKNISIKKVVRPDACIFVWLVRCRVK